MRYIANSLEEEDTLIISKYATLYFHSSNFLREKETPPSLAPQNHTHGNTYSEVHPHYNENRVRELGNDNSSNHRQTRSQSAVPDRVPGMINIFICKYLKQTLEHECIKTSINSLNVLFPLLYKKM